MAIFGSKKNTKEVKEKVVKAKAVKATKETAVTPVVVGASAGRDLTGILVRPRVTEKATLTSEKGVYVFEVSENSTKHNIAAAVKMFYQVTPEKVRVARTPAKQVIVRGRLGMKSGVKKAYVYLKKGEKIEIV